VLHLYHGIRTFLTARDAHFDVRRVIKWRRSASGDRRAQLGALITLVGAMLIYGAFNPKQRPLILIIAGLSKLIFVGLLVLLGSQYLPKTIVPIAVDGIAVILYAICLLGAHRDAVVYPQASPIHVEHS
jgi:hypothetical protein